MNSTDPPPWILERDSSAGWVIREVANRIVRTPTGTTITTSDDALPQGVVGPMLTIGHGDMMVHLPIIHEWPGNADDREALTSTLREISEACHSDASHQDDLLPYVTAAVAIAIGNGTMPEDAVVTDGRHAVEFLIDHDSLEPILHVATGNGGTCRIPSPEGTGVPRPRIPCRVDEIQNGKTLSVVMAFAVNDVAGTVCDAVRVDAMDVLRFTSMQQREGKPT